ncbi:hypothetical protein NUSPORA_02505 [Nucleospora cyclopteri]
MARTIKYTLPKIITVILLYSLGIFCIVISVKPFIDDIAELKDYANIGFILLIVFFMAAIVKVKRNRYFYMWAGSFTLCLYSEILLVFYEDIFI